MSKFDEFIGAFARATGMSLRDADDNWAAYSRQLNGPQLEEIESGGAEAGERMAAEYRRDYPVEQQPA